MNEDRRAILDMLAQGKITADEADRLLSALEAPAPQSQASAGPGAPKKPKYLRVTIDADTSRNGPSKVNSRVPMQLLRAGVRLSSLIPAEARSKVNESMRRKGYPDFDLKDFKPENIEELVSQLDNLTFDVDNDRAKVRIFCE